MSISTPCSPSSTTICRRKAVFLAMESRRTSLAPGYTIFNGMPGIPAPVPISRRAKLPSAHAGPLKRQSNRERVDEVLDLDLVVVRDAGQVDPAVPLHQLLVVRLELLELMLGQRQAELPGSFDEFLHHGRFMIAQGAGAGDGGVSARKAEMTGDGGPSVPFLLYPQEWGLGG